MSNNISDLELNYQLSSAMTFVVGTVSDGDRQPGQQSPDTIRTHNWFPGNWVYNGYHIPLPPIELILTMDRAPTPPESLPDLATTFMVPSLLDDSATASRGRDPSPAMSHPALISFTKGICESVPVTHFEGPRGLGSEHVDQLCAVARLTDFPAAVGGHQAGGRTAVFTAPTIGAKKLVLLSYPLHHGMDVFDWPFGFLAEDVNILFICGTKDPYCVAPMLAQVRENTNARCYVLWIEGGDHELNNSEWTPVSEAREKLCIAAGRLTAEWLRTTYRSPYLTEGTLRWDQATGWVKFSGWVRPRLLGAGAEIAAVPISPHSSSSSNPVVISPEEADIQNMLDQVPTAASSHGSLSSSPLLVPPPSSVDREPSPTSIYSLSPTTAEVDDPMDTDSDGSDSVSSRRSNSSATLVEDPFALEQYEMLSLPRQNLGGEPDLDQVARGLDLMMQRVADNHVVASIGNSADENSDEDVFFYIDVARRLQQMHDRIMSNQHREDHAEDPADDDDDQN